MVSFGLRARLFRVFSQRDVSDYDQHHYINLNYAPRSMEVPYFPIPRLLFAEDHCSQGLLDFSHEFDVSLMDRVVMTFYTGHGQEVLFANTIC